MKIKITFFAISTFLATLSMIVLAYNNQATVLQTDDWSNLKLKIDTPKQDYLLGEVVQLNFEVINEGSKKIVLPGCSTVEGGYMRIHISYADQPFKEKFGNKSRFQIDGGCGDATPLEPGQTFKDSATVLWNVKPEVSHLNEVAAKRIAEERIMSDYAFPKPGIYLIKAVLHLPGENRPTIESAPIQIIVNEPTGENLTVWNKIKNDKEFAYFIQYGEFLTPKAEQKEKLSNTLNEIVEKYPYSFYANGIKENLKKLRADKKLK